MRRRTFLALLAAMLLEAALPPAQAVAETAGQGVKLLRSAAFRGTFDALPQWKRVLSVAKEQVRVLNTCGDKSCPPGATSWQKIIREARGRDEMAQLRMVNAFFNKWPYRLDLDLYGVSDWWAAPREFLKQSGDCEDYAIIKYFALRELGFAAEDLRIVAVKDRIRGLGHAILAVFVRGDAYILDNTTSVVLSHAKYTHYTPQYSVNEEYRWAHIPIAKP